MKIIDCCECQQPFESVRGYKRCLVCRQENLSNRAVAATANWRAAQYGVEGRLTPKDVKIVRAIYGLRCLCCGASPQEPFDGIAVLDHIQPMSKGGQNVTTNLQPLCRVCNVKKSDRFQDYRPDKGDAILAYRELE